MDGVKKNKNVKQTNENMSDKRRNNKEKNKNLDVETCKREKIVNTGNRYHSRGSNAGDLF